MPEIQSQGALSTTSVPEDRPDSPILELLESVRQFASLQGRPVSPETYHHVAQGIHDLILKTERVERIGVPREEILIHIDAARKVQAESAFVHRIQSWPRGYPGDFETVEYICDQANRHAPDTLAHFIEAFTLGTPIAQQHRNKVTRQSTLIRNTVRTRTQEYSDSRPKILSIACGGSRDLRLISDDLIGRCEIYLNDFDTGALEYSRFKLGALADQITTVPGSAFRVLGKLRAYGPFQHILAGGLFDYLTDKQGTTLLRQLKPLLAHDGELTITNIAVNNPYRIWLNYFANWNLIHRAESEVTLLFASAGLDKARVHLEREASGLAIVATYKN